MNIRLASAATVGALGLFLSAEQAWSSQGESPKCESNPIVSRLLEQSSTAISSVPSSAAPERLLDIGSAVENCSLERSQAFVLRAFDAALALPCGTCKPSPNSSAAIPADSQGKRFREVKRRTALQVIELLCSWSDKHQRPEFLTSAIDLSDKTDPQIVGRSKLYLFAIKRLLARHEEDRIRELLFRAENADGAFPFELGLVTIRAASDDFQKEILGRVFLAVSAGQPRSEPDMRVIEEMANMVPLSVASDALKKCIRTKKTEQPADAANLAVIRRATRLLMRLDPQVSSEYRLLDVADDDELAPPKKTASEDPMVRAYEDIQALAEQSSSAVAERVMAIQDQRSRQAMLTSCISALRAAGKNEAADRVAEVLSSLLPTGSRESHPADDLLRDTATMTGPAAVASLQRSLDMAERILAEEDGRYQAARSESERADIYDRGSQEAIAVYSLAAESSFDLAMDSASRVKGPRQAEVLTTLLAHSCEKPAKVAPRPEKRRGHCTEGSQQ